MEGNRGSRGYGREKKKAWKENINKGKIEHNEMK